MIICTVDPVSIVVAVLVELFCPHGHVQNLFAFSILSVLFSKIAFFIIMDKFSGLCNGNFLVSDPT